MHCQLVWLSVSFSTDFEFLEFIFLDGTCSTSHSGGNFVDGSPPALSTAAVLVGLRLGPRRSVNLGGKICIVSHAWLLVRSFGKFRSLFYVLNLFWRSFSLYGLLKSYSKLLQVFQVVLSKSRIFEVFRFLGIMEGGLLYESFRRELG